MGLRPTNRDENRRPCTVAPSKNDDKYDSRYCQHKNGQSKDGLRRRRGWREDIGRAERRTCRLCGGQSYAPEEERECFHRAPYDWFSFKPHLPFSSEFAAG